MDNSEFYTPNGYDKRKNSELSPAMEDYLEMVYRESFDERDVRVKSISSRLNVTPPSTSKMLHKLRELGYVSFEPYGIINLTEKGVAQGVYLLHRHDVLQRFFRFINNSENELELVERIEHYIDRNTVENIEKLLSRTHLSGKTR